MPIPTCIVFLIAKYVSSPELILSSLKLILNEPSDSSNPPNQFVSVPNWFLYSILTSPPSCVLISRICSFSPDSIVRGREGAPPIPI